jgi:hypothetical protein
VKDNINIDSTIAGSVDDNINIDSTIVGSVDDNINPLPFYKRLKIPMGKSAPYSREKQIIQWSREKG